MTTVTADVDRNIQIEGLEALRLITPVSIKGSESLTGATVTCDIHGNTQITLKLPHGTLVSTGYGSEDTTATGAYISLRAQTFQRLIHELGRIFYHDGEDVDATREVYQAVVDAELVSIRKLLSLRRELGMPGLVYDRQDLPSPFPVA